MLPQHICQKILCQGGITQAKQYCLIFKRIPLVVNTYHLITNLHYNKIMKNIWNLHHSVLLHGSQCFLTLKTNYTTSLKFLIFQNDTHTFKQCSHSVARKTSDILFFSCCDEGLWFYCNPTTLMHRVIQAKVNYDQYLAIAVRFVPCWQ